MSMKRPTRRSILAWGASSPLLATDLARAQTTDRQLTIADVGAEPSAAMRRAFYDPFERETGIRINAVPHEADPVTQFKLMVETRSYLWDVCMLNSAHVAQLEAEGDYLGRLDIPAADTADFLPNMVSPVWMGFSVYAVMMAWQTSHFPNGGPKDWRDYWDVRRFPGRRSLCRSPTFSLELALLADGVAPADLYPLDVDRAFASLRRIKDHIAIWWANGAQNTFLLESDEVDLSDSWSARAQAARTAGAPISLLWNGLYDVDGWGIPIGSPQASLARTFIRFCARADRQAEYARHIANGPTNRRSFDFLTPERALELPTAPENFKGLTGFDAAWWGTNLAATSERFEEFLLE
ncbi:ABC transporter substrate-binding protein [Tanticharoenia sakaeratensis]|uniref:Spermidine/putrescine-binding periplasmic protein n=1 Tax=Tanticharoenia sakaeratensis NBRC 103193 TaxID=1231623 RepID=A0A0D6MQS7_9PROT|nr:ABC transporter substrate-binding protein [Tanticharoenia sakaeratensis]GAN55643.1 spermidine/putrescine-binding periplasmic protein [Tanticharoenia sakaeratensis NBRC 103193]GBQ16492.1 spermidine/putrescine-binding periplasmic protein [Tanticharoenia sakaeratensis NBRC 103193]